jgi:hypothetical protein
VPLKADDVAVFDRGYFDCAYFAELTGSKVWFGTRRSFMTFEEKCKIPYHEEKQGFQKE